VQTQIVSGIHTNSSNIDPERPMILFVMKAYEAISGIEAFFNDIWITGGRGWARLRGEDVTGGGSARASSPTPPQEATAAADPSTQWAERPNSGLEFSLAMRHSDVWADA
jgi:hypothetical protein